MARAAPYDRDTALDAAMALFWEKGFHATSLKDLEAALAMKPGSIYAAFDSKENLYLLALERYFDKSRQGVRAQLARATDPLAALADHLRSLARLTPGDLGCGACMLTRSLVDTNATDPALATTTRRYLADMEAEFAAVFARARDLGLLPATADVRRLARRYQANLSALRLALMQGMAPQELTDLAEDMATEIENLKSNT
ncbi:TetR/AcrR family transcriptional regulator [Aliiroseovarius crassostreae]|uniref:TetR/AcrR family transcriptional regulator n=1 Tax=Aliiroseovarius crassostreae TaxID=154981 RepID=UPI003C7D71E9